MEQTEDSDSSPLLQLLQLILSLPLAPPDQQSLLSSLSSLPSLHTPGLRLRQVTSLLTPGLALSPPSLSCLLEVLESLIEGLGEEEGSMRSWGEEGPDSALCSSAGEEGAEGRAPELSPSFQPYLRALLDNPGEELSRHLERLVLRSSAATRHLLAVQVVLPALDTQLVEEAGEEREAACEELLELLCSLVTQQPTAMALIRNQRVWRRVKVQASSPGQLSRVSQQIIKTIVLSSNKFIKIKLSEAEAMALQDDENDVINFDQRDQNAQYWIFKQLYQVLVQSSIEVVNSGWPEQEHHLVSAWQISLSLVKKVGNRM